MLAWWFESGIGIVKWYSRNNNFFSLFLLFFDSFGFAVLAIGLLGWLVVVSCFNFRVCAFPPDRRRPFWSPAAAFRQCVGSAFLISV